VRYLITGVGGFAGGYLADLLQEMGHEVFGIVHTIGAAATLNELKRRVPRLQQDHIVTGDVCEYDVVNEAVRRSQPDGIFHLAAQSSVKAGEAELARTFVVNTVGTLQVLAAASSAAGHCRVVVVSSGEVYGRGAGKQPVGEDVPLRPVSMYAVSKAASELLMHQAIESSGIDAVCVRPFNHTGPYQLPQFVCADFARQIVAVEKKAQRALRVGNLEAVRDFLDVRDVVGAYWHVFERGERNGVYNISSGIGRRIVDVLDGLRCLTTVEIAVEQDAARLRPADVPVLIGDNRRVRALGWQPQKTWDETLKDVLADWRRRVGP